MAEGEHTIITRIPRERLNQIAGRKLAGLGLAVRLSADRETLEGELAFAAALPLPPGSPPVARARFAVLGHDHLRFLEPPLSALAPVLFHDVERSSELEARVALAVAERVQDLGQLAARLRALRVEAVVDPARLAVRAVVKGTRHAFELLGGPEGLRAARAAPVGGRPFDLPAGLPRVVLEEHVTAESLGTWLDARLVAAEAGEAPPEEAPRRVSQGTIEEQPPPRNALTLGQLVEAFGADAAVAPTAALELVREYRDETTQYRLVATRELGSVFKGRLIGPGGDLWTERFELDRFPGATPAVRAALGAPAAGTGGSSALAALVDAAAPGAGGTAAVPQHLLPHQGEVWVMNVVVEQMGEEVRYVGTDIDGRPYGAARVLKRPDFEEVFASERGGWRLLVQVDEVGGGVVAYRQLDRQRQPLGAQRSMAVGVMVANFVPEAAAY